MKTWKSYEKGDDRIIAYMGTSIYKANPKESEVEETAYQFELGVAPEKNCTEIPQHYLKEINLQEGKNYIEVLFAGDSVEHLRIKDDEKRREVFEYLKANVPGSRSFTDKFSKLRAGRKPLIAMVVVAALFAWTFSVASGIEEGNEYEVVGNARSTASIVVGLASIGKTNVILLFGALFAIALIAFIVKTKKPKVVERIQVVRR